MGKNVNIKSTIYTLAVVLFWSCSVEETPAGRQAVVSEFIDIEQQLEHAYSEGSQKALDTVFLMWEEKIPRLSFKEISMLSDTVGQIYEIFREFYTPEDLNRVTGGAHENFETNFRYIVAQNSLEFAVVDTNPKYYFHRGVTIRERTLQDFRPTPDETVFGVVYLSSSADSMIYRYLYQPDGSPEPDHLQRVAFLRQAIQLTHHHWIMDYHKATMPIASHIYVNETLTEALVTFRVFYQFGNAYLEKEDKEWVLVHSELTMIE